MTPRTGAPISSTALALLKSGVVQGEGSEIDSEFYALKLTLALPLVVAALRELASFGLVHESEWWRCNECGARNSTSESACSSCRTPSTENAARSWIFFRPATDAAGQPKSESRDPAAVFLVHGMNTLGGWQESFAWKFQLLYGYSIPVFVFKYGNDKLTPMFRWSQNRRAKQLAQAIRKAQRDLKEAGRDAACDVVAHSFGTLLLTHMLLDPDIQDIRLGKIILTGSIAPRAVPWSSLLADGKVEAVLNHRAGRDIWVKLAPWVFPGVGSSGVHGFLDQAHLVDRFSPEFKHSDFFTSENFDQVIRTWWTPFLSLAEPAVLPVPVEAKRFRDRRYWIARLILGMAAVIIVVSLYSCAPHA